MTRLTWHKGAVGEQHSTNGRWTLTVKDASRRSRWVLLRDNATGQTYECSTVTEAKETARDYTTDGDA